ncbi:MAG TPA: hypothetical protein VNR18_11955 [Hyphomicrobiales bacterium]|nr:hypothetical protein [Hyphomicrobiales bacterium]
MSRSKILRIEQAGIGLPAALFVITVMALVGVAISRLVALNAMDTTEELQLTRALYAAESGAGMALSALYPPAGYPAYGASPQGNLTCPVAEYEFTAAGLENCEARVVCNSTPHESVQYFTLTSTGRCGAVQRVVQVQSRFEKHEP